MADYAPIYDPGQAISATASAAITGGQLLAVSGTGPTVAPAGANSATVVGVAVQDAASGARIAYLSGGVHELTAAANITAGQTLNAAASGQVTPWVSGTDAADLIVGRALTTAASAAKCRVQFI